MRILNIGIVIAVIVNFSSCGSKDSGGSAGSSSEIDGTWSKACYANDDGSSKDTFVGSSGAYTVTSISYSDDKCTTETLSMVVSGTFTLGAAVTTPAGAKEFTSKSSKIMLILKDENFVNAFNGTTQGSTAICGGGFVKDTAKELNATNCAGDSTFGTMFNDSFNVYKVDGTKLSLGECGQSGTANDCTVATKRATEFEAESYTKS